MQRRPRIENAAHLRYLRALPCCICGNDIQSEAAHCRYADRSVAKPITGVATKSHDFYAVPLCGECHRSQHDYGNEREWWHDRDIDPVKLGLALFAITGDHELGLEIIAANCKHVVWGD